MSPVRKSKSDGLTSIHEGSFDTSALQHELEEALEADRLYKLTDSTKKRAIHTASNYEEFRNLVTCADLKPVSQKELQTLGRTDRRFNTSCKHRNNQRQFESNKISADKNIHKSAKELQKPKSNVEFRRMWKRTLPTSDDKYLYLRMTTPDCLKTIFTFDLDADLLAEIAQVLLANADGSEEKESFALDCLEALSSTQRFQLTLDFLTNNQVESIRKLLFQMTKDHDGIARIEKLYRIERQEE